MPSTRDLISAYFEAFNSHDAEAMLNLLDENVIHDINEGPREVGKEAFGKFKTHMDATYKEHISDLVIMENGDRGAAEFTCSGTYFNTDPGLPEATGQTYSIWAAAFFEVKNDKIIRISSCYSLKGWIEAIS